MEACKLDLFKQALNEGFEKRIDSVIAGYSDPITYSKKHRIAMRTIIHGKISDGQKRTLPIKRIIAIVAIVAFLLTACAIVYRTEIRELIREITADGEGIRIKFFGKSEEPSKLSERYELTYVPDGYTMMTNEKYLSSYFYEYHDSKENKLIFEQCKLDSVFLIDSDGEDERIIQVEGYQVYFKALEENYFYLWNDGKYGMTILSDLEISDEDIALMVKGVTVSSP